METIDLIRLDNARRLLKEVGGQKAMIEKTGRSQSQISQIMGAKAFKPIGKTVARSLEKTFNKNKGWMDVDRRKLSEQGAQGFDALLIRLYSLYESRDEDGKRRLQQALLSLINLSE